jgi:hypothetical protein
MAHMAPRAPRCNGKITPPPIPLSLDGEPLIEGLPYYASVPAEYRRPKTAGELIEGHEFFELRDRTLHRSFFNARRA